MVVTTNVANNGAASCTPANFTSSTGASFTSAVVTLTYTNQIPAAGPANADVTFSVLDSQGTSLGTATGASPLVVTLDATKVPTGASFALVASASFGVTVSLQGTSTFSGSAAFELK